MTTTEKKKLTIADLNGYYQKADSVDKHIFIEQRSNVLLASGDHYTKRHSRYWANIRDSKQLNDETKLRITKNHIHRICNIYINNIFAIAPGVVIVPKNDKELHDQKVAQLRNSVWQGIKTRHRMRERIRDLIDNYIKVGEICWKIIWDPNAGDLKGYTHAVDENGQPQFDQNGQPVASDEPVFAGDWVIEDVFAANLLRDPNSKKMSDSWNIVRKMVDTQILKDAYKNDDEKLGFVASTNNDEFMVFDGASGSYEKSKDQTLIREFYFPKSVEYPEGYYFITTQSGILEEGPLPYGIYPIIFDGFDSIATSPRKRSIIKQLRPVQAELNRAASAMATHQITLGDDKLLIQGGTSITQSAKLPGVRALNYSGAAPTVLAGRTGDQYVSYVAAQQEEMYVIANMPEEMADKSPANTDPFAELFKTMRHKKKYVLYAEKIELFLQRVCETMIEGSKYYYTDEQLINDIGRNEIVNIAEFREPGMGCTDIKTEAQTDDLETKMGKQLTLTHTLQYVGSQLGREDIGRILRAMPFMDNEEAFTEFTTDYDNLTNDILKLDRGEQPDINAEEDHKYAMKRLTHRMKQPDFKFLDPQIQQNYSNFRSLHSQLEAEQLQKIKQAESEFIPSGGYLVRMDFYITDPQSPGKTKRASLPYESVAWLIQKLEAQGTELNQLERLQQGAMAEVAGQMINQHLLPGGSPMPGQMPNAPQGGQSLTGV